MQIKGEQRKVEQILSSKNYKLDLVDIAAGAEAKEKMREIAGNPKAMPPQIANGDQYCGVSKLNFIISFFVFEYR